MSPGGPAAGGETSLRFVFDVHVITAHGETGQLMPSGLPACTIVCVDFFLSTNNRETKEMLYSFQHHATYTGILQDKFVRLIMSSL